MAGWPRQDLVLGKKKKKKNGGNSRDKFAALSTLVPLPKSYPYEREAQCEERSLGTLILLLECGRIGENTLWP